MKKDHKSALKYLLGGALCLVISGIFLTLSWGTIPGLAFLAIAAVAFIMAWNLGWPWL